MDNIRTDHHVLEWFHFPQALVTVTSDLHVSNAAQVVVLLIHHILDQSWCSHQLYGPRQANLILIAYASSEGSGEPAHPRNLARTSAARSYKQWVKWNLQTESQIPGPSEWLGMRS